MIQGLLLGCLFYTLGRAYRLWVDKKTVSLASLYPAKHPANWHDATGALATSHHPNIPENF